MRARILLANPWDRSWSNSNYCFTNAFNLFIEGNVWVSFPNFWLFVNIWSWATLLLQTQQIPCNIHLHFCHPIEHVRRSFWRQLILSSLFFRKLSQKFLLERKRHQHSEKLFKTCKISERTSLLNINAIKGTWSRVSKIYFKIDSISLGSVHI